ncbi:hypothetical protein OROGR_016010 [Orobanche gracilis]
MSFLKLVAVILLVTASFVPATSSNARLSTWSLKCDLVKEFYNSDCNQFCIDTYRSKPEYGAVRGKCDWFFRYAFGKGDCVCYPKLV